MIGLFILEAVWLSCKGAGLKIRRSRVLAEVVPR